MNRIFSLSLTVALGLTCFSLTQAQDDAEAVAIANASGSAYIDAWQAKDAAALAALFTEDAEYTTDDGTLIEGAEALQARSEESLAEAGDAEIEVVVESARFLTENVISENGYATVYLDGEETTTMYNAVHVKKEGGWKIAELHESALPGPSPAVVALTELDWLVGTWTVEGAEDGVTIEAKWVLDGSFCLRTTTIPGEDEEGEPFVSVEVIGFDPNEEELRSWIFDNEGGFGRGTWREDEGTWLVRLEATMPEGGSASSEHIVSLEDEGKVSVTSVNRMLDGEALPNREPIVLVRSRETQTAEAE